MKDVLNMQVRSRIYSLLFLIVMMNSACSSSSLSPDQLFDKAVFAAWDAQQETLSSDTSGTVIGYEFEIFVTNGDELEPIKLTDNSVTDWFPSWSPNGSKIAFVSERDGNDEIYIMNSDGTNQLNITNHPSDDSGPAWSPDGTQIAFISRRDGNHEIYIMNSDGTNQTNVTNSPANEYQVS